VAGTSEPSSTKIVVWCNTLKNPGRSYSWTGLLAPAGTPTQIVDRLNGAINQGLQSPELNSNLGRLGAEAKAGSPQDFAAFIAEETRKWGAIVKASGVKLD
jgi:tripartite-type tricarboxylate transporter receptor subunit TctC